MATQGWPRHGVELASQHQGRHPRACRNEWQGSKIRPARADAVQLPSVQPVRASWKVLAIVRTIAALDRRVRRAILYRSGRELGRKNRPKDLPKTLRLPVMNDLDHAG